MLRLPLKILKPLDRYHKAVNSYLANKMLDTMLSLEVDKTYTEDSLHKHLIDKSIKAISTIVEELHKPFSSGNLNLAVPLKEKKIQHEKINYDEYLSRYIDRVRIKFKCAINDLMKHDFIDKDTLSWASGFVNEPLKSSNNFLTKLLTNKMYEQEPMMLNLYENVLPSQLGLDSSEQVEEGTKNLKQLRGFIEKLYKNNSVEDFISFMQILLSKGQPSEAINYAKATELTIPELDQVLGKPNHKWQLMNSILESLKSRARAEISDYELVEEVSQSAFQHMNPGVLI